MSISALTPQSLALFLRGCVRFLFVYREAVNALNVFPVPDGDTGINMFLTINAAAENIKDESTVQKIAQDFSMGALMGARGNSGVILSQVFRGFSQGVIATANNHITATGFAEAMQKGVDLSYKSVMKPVEGTILTVFREFTAAAKERAKETNDIIELLKYALSAGEIALANTPNQLSVLREAGVVDAGGRGLLYIFEGGLRALTGEGLDEEYIVPVSRPKTVAIAASSEEIEFCYCTEFLIMSDDLDVDSIRAAIDSTVPGDCLLVVGTEEVIKVHFHNNNPGKVLAKALEYGSLHDLKIENMRDQHTEFKYEDYTVEKETRQDVSCNQLCGVVAISVGNGIKDLFNSVGAYVLNGGQTMNPSAEEILNAINYVQADEIVLLPNNSNIILAAEQAKQMSKKPVCIVPSKYITQGLSSMLNFDPSCSAEKNCREMIAQISKTISGEVTYAVRESSYNGFKIKKDDFLVLKEGEIVLVEHDLTKAICALVSKMVDTKEKDQSLISLIYGNDLEAGFVKEITDQLEEIYPDMDVESRYGGQPLYYFLVSVE